jgi:hypothetical protein
MNASELPSLVKQGSNRKSAVTDPKQPHRHVPDAQYLMFVYEDPTNLLGEDEVTIHIRKQGLELISATQDQGEPVFYAWELVKSVKANHQEHNEDEMDLLVIDVTGVGAFTLEADDAISVRRSCVSFHPGLVMNSQTEAKRSPPKPAKPSGTAGHTNPFLHHLNAFKMNHPTKLLIVNGAERVTIPVGEFLFKEGDPATSFYIVMQGKLTVLWKNTREVAELHEGEIFGHGPFLFQKFRQHLLPNTANPVQLAEGASTSQTMSDMSKRNTSVQAKGAGIDACQVFKISMELFDEINHTRPVSRLRVASRL